MGGRRRRAPARHAAIHVDETSLRVDRKNHWIHVYAAGGITLKVLHPRRGCEAIEAIGIIPDTRAS